jgi:hypothetical protein
LRPPLRHSRFYLPGAIPDRRRRRQVQTIIRRGFVSPVVAAGGERCTHAECSPPEAGQPRGCGGNIRRRAPRSDRLHNKFQLFRALTPFPARYLSDREALRIPLACRSASYIGSVAAKSMWFLKGALRGTWDRSPGSRRRNDPDERQKQVPSTWLPARRNRARASRAAVQGSDSRTSLSSSSSSRLDDGEQKRHGALEAVREPTSGSVLHAKVQVGRSVTHCACSRGSGAEARVGSDTATMQYLDSESTLVAA